MRILADFSSKLLLPVRRTAGALPLPLLVANPFATRRAPLHAADFPLVLLFSEKAGCTSLTKWFLFQIGKLEEANAFDPSVHQYRKRVLYRQPGYGWQGLRLVVMRQRPIVKLVRDPYDRTVSSFLQALRSAGARHPKAWARRLIADARAHAGRPATAVPALSFADFVRFVASSGTERGQINGHVARQHLPGETRYVDRFIRLERFGEEIRQIEAEYGLATSPLETITKSGHHRSGLQRLSPDTACVAEHEITSEQAHKGPLPAYETLYSAECRRLVRTCFAADFEAYGYEG